MHGRRVFISFLFDQTGCPSAGGGACVKHYKFVWERFATAIKIERIPYIRLSIKPKSSQRAGLQVFGLKTAKTRA
jgi:hypothetical protein